MHHLVFIILNKLIPKVFISGRRGFILTEQQVDFVTNKTIDIIDKYYYLGTLYFILKCRDYENE